MNGRVEQLRDEIEILEFIVTRFEQASSSNLPLFQKFLDDTRRELEMLTEPKSA